MPLLIFLFLFLPGLSMAGCRLAAPPHTLEPAKMRMIGELQAFLGHIDDESNCDQDLAAKEKNINTWLGFFRQNLEDTGNLEANWVNGLLSQSAPAKMPASCALDAELAEAEGLYERFPQRAAEIDGRLNSVAYTLLSIRAERAIFENRKMAAALLDCRHEQMTSRASGNFMPQDEDYEAEERKTCLAQSGAEPELWEAIDLLAASPEGVATGLYCLLGDHHRVRAEKNLTIASGIERGAEKLLRESIKYIETTQAAAPDRLRRIRQKRREFRALQCDEHQKSESLKIETRTRKLFAEEGWGSGFVLSGPNGKPELVTARHVVFEGENQESSRVKLLGVKAEKQSRRGDRFPVAPGSYDRSRDLIKRDLGKAAPAFLAVNESQVSAAGETVVLYGYPASREGRFTSHRCKVKGIGRNIFDTAQAESYVVHCPGAEGHIAGMSGGPVINQSGEVIGAITAHNPLTNMVIVQPIFRGAGGENRFGFQRVFHYDSCFKEAGTTVPQRCQVIPGLTYQESIP